MNDEQLRFEPTSEQDVIDLAMFLLQNEHSGDIIRRVGVFGYMSDAEDGVIASVVDAYCKERVWENRDPLELLSIPVALARWVSAGKFTSVDGDEARAFVADRQFNRGTDQTRGFRRPTVEEALWVNRDLRANEVYWDIVCRARTGRIRRKVSNGVLRPIQDKIERKYGLINRIINGLMIQRRLANGDIPDLDSPEAIHVIKLHNHIL